MVILVTGGGGTIGGAVCDTLVERHHTPVIYSRNYAHHLPVMRRTGARSVVGDLGDLGQLVRAMKEHAVTGVIHAAANKHISACEDYPTQAAAANIEGSMNVLRAADYAGVGNVLLVSTDKACSGRSFYGVTKQVAERIFLDHDRGQVVRLGNVVGSAGSVLGLWKEARAAGRPIRLHTVGGESMRRFFIHPAAAAAFITDVFFDPLRRRIVFPPMPVIDMGTLADVMRGAVERVAGHPKESRDETMVSADEAARVTAAGPWWAIGDKVVHEIEGYDTARFPALSAQETKEFFNVI